MKVALIIGSVRTGRQSHKIAYYVENILHKRNIETAVIDLLKQPLPVYGALLGSGSEENIKAHAERLSEADAIILITPEYHGSFSGVLKNTLDHFWIEFQKKPIGVIGTSMGKLGGINASTQLQHVILSLGAYPLPVKLLVPEIHLLFDESFNTQNENMIKLTSRFLDEFLWFAEAVYQKKLLKESNKLSLTTTDLNISLNTRTKKKVL